MVFCNLEYIPKRLHHSDERKIIDTFYVSDILYRRVSDKFLDNPYSAVTLSDLSHNIGINNQIEISKKSDVLFSILEGEDFEVYDSFKVLALKVISIDENNHYDKVFNCEKNTNLKVRLLLSHDPVCCMYPHCVFRFYIYNDDDHEIEVTYENYSSTLGDKKKYKYLRDKLRHELSLMIIREAISYDGFE